MNFITDTLKDKQIQKDVLTDWLKFGTMFVVSQLLASKPLSDQAWIRSSLHTLLGFTVYDVLTKKLIKNTMTDGVMKTVFDTWLKVGTMLVVSRLLSGKSLTDPTWVRSSLYTLLGFTVYHAFVPKLIPNTGQAGPIKDLIDDVLAFGTMFVVSRQLSGLPFDAQWMKESAYSLVGFGAYDIFTKKFLQQ